MRFLRSAFQTGFEFPIEDLVDNDAVNGADQPGIYRYEGGHVTVVDKIENQFNRFGGQSHATIEAIAARGTPSPVPASCSRSARTPTTRSRSAAPRAA